MVRVVVEAADPSSPPLRSKAPRNKIQRAFEKEAEAAESEPGAGTEDDVPDLSRLAIRDDGEEEKSGGAAAAAAGRGSAAVPVAARTRAGQQRQPQPQPQPQPQDKKDAGAAAPRTRAAGKKAAGAAGAAAARGAVSSPSPTLSRYGVSLGDIREHVHDLPPEDALAHSLHLTGFPAGGDGGEDPKARDELAKPWTDVGALIRWLPGSQGAVATFCSIPTAQRAARKVAAGPGGIKAAPLKSCPEDIQRQALAAGIVIPPRPKADTAASSRLILGALGMRSPASSTTTPRPSIGGSSGRKGPGTKETALVTPSASASASAAGRSGVATRSQAKAKAKKDEEDTGGGGDAWDA